MDLLLLHFKNIFKGKPYLYFEGIHIFFLFYDFRQIGQSISSMIHPVCCRLHFIFFHLQLGIWNVIANKWSIWSIIKLQWFPSKITKYMFIFFFALSRNGFMNYLFHPGYTPIAGQHACLAWDSTPSPPSTSTCGHTEVEGPTWGSLP